jgi:uncharacterized membrane protein YraQ (UPF0718 family)
MLREKKEKRIIQRLREREIGGTWYFLSAMILVYIILLFVNSGIFLSSLNLFFDIFSTIIPIFFVVFILMAISNYFITPEISIKYLKRKGPKKWFFTIIGGILSSGPIYMWYPLLADLKEKGISNGLIACFLYNRSVKIPLIPIMLVYFNWKYVFVLLFIMIFISVIQGIIINKFYEEEK